MKTITLLLTVLVCQVAAAECVDDIAPTSGPFDLEYAEGQVLDLSTGLIWYRCQLGQTFENGVCIGSPLSGTWLNALTMAQEFTFAGHDDWRVPNIKELQSLMEYSCHSPMIDPALFAEEISFPLWSSTPESYESGTFNHYVHGMTWLGQTFSDQKDETFYTLLVRDLNDS